MPKGPGGKLKKGLDMKNPEKFKTNHGKTTPPSKPSTSKV